MNAKTETLSDYELKLGVFLNKLLKSADSEGHVSRDPVGLVHEFPPEDQPVVGLLVSSLAYGRVSLLRRAASDLLSRIGDSPKSTIMAAGWDEVLDCCEGFQYRMSKAEDVADLLWGIRSLLLEYGTLENFYVSTDGTHLERSAAFVEGLRVRRHRSELARGLKYLIPSPAAGSATKRLHLYFRWMIRESDGVDLGLWESVSPADLILPLDTHTSRICRYLGLSDRTSVDLKMAKEVTAKLKRLNPEDPTQFDFAICHLGISGACLHYRSQAQCEECPLEPVCQLE